MTTAGAETTFWGLPLPSTQLSSALFEIAVAAATGASTRDSSAKSSLAEAATSSSFEEVEAAEARATPTYSHIARNAKSPRAGKWSGREPSRFARGAGRPFKASSTNLLHHASAQLIWTRIQKKRLVPKASVVRVASTSSAAGVVITQAGEPPSSSFES